MAHDKRFKTATAAIDPVKAYSLTEAVGLIIPAVITVYSDRSFTFELRTPPAAVLLKRAAKIAKGSGAPNRDKVAKVTRKQLVEIAELKAPDLNANDIDAAVAIIAGTARSMGIDVEG